MAISLDNNLYERALYEALMTMGFALDTNHRYIHFLRFTVHIAIVDWLFSIVLAPGYTIWKEYNVLPMFIILELIQYTLAGILYLLTLIVFLFKKDAIFSNYRFIQLHFVQWSKKKRTNPNHAYDKVLKYVNDVKFGGLFVYCALTIGPLLATLNDLGKIPLDDRSHFPLLWPKFIEINDLRTYGMIYLTQIISMVFTYFSVVSFNFGFVVMLYEFNHQFEMLLDELNEAFDYRHDEQFERHFIDCIIHHQMIIKFLNDFKSYFKWVILIEIIGFQVLFATSIYNLTKANAAFGYKVKLVGVLLFNIIPFLFHCEIGEKLLNKHKQLADHIYNMMWYDMPAKHKQLIVIMFQRTQKDLSLNAAIFSNEFASRSLITKVIKQVYTLLNLLLNI